MIGKNYDIIILQMRKENKKWLIIVGVILAVLVVVSLFVFLPKMNKVKAPTDGANSSENDSDKDVEAVSTQEEIDGYDQAIKSDPNNADNYIRKSEIEYLAGDKDGALNTVLEGLKNAPDNELLKSRKDVLGKEFIGSSDQENPKQ